MAASDARPIPRKNTAFRVTFGLYDADGDLVTGATSPDSEVSIDGGTFADCTNEATEIATASGMYYLDLTAAEMNGDTVAVIVKSGNAKTLPLVFYPEELGDVRVDVCMVSGDSAAADAWETMLDGTGGNKLSLSQLNIVAASNDSAIVATGAGTGSGIIATGGATGHGQKLVGGGTSGDGVNLTVTGASNSGIKSTGGASGFGLDGTLGTDSITGTSLAANAVDEILDEVVEGEVTLRQAIRIILSFVGAKVTGGGTTTLTYRDIGDTKSRITQTVDSSGNRSASTLDGS